MNAPIAQSQTTLGESAGAAAAYRFDHVSDADLLTSTQRLVGPANQLLADVAPNRVFSSCITLSRTLAAVAKLPRTSRCTVELITR